MREDQPIYANLCQQKNQSPLFLLVDVDAFDLLLTLTLGKGGEGRESFWGSKSIFETVRESLGWSEASKTKRFEIENGDLELGEIYKEGENTDNDNSFCETSQNPMTLGRGSNPLKEGGDRLPTDEEAAAELEKRRTREEA
jgi:hypothetical protein